MEVAAAAVRAGAPCCGTREKEEGGSLLAVMYGGKMCRQWRHLGWVSELTAGGNGGKTPMCSMRAMGIYPAEVEVCNGGAELEKTEVRPGRRQLTCSSWGPVRPWPAIERAARGKKMEHRPGGSRAPRGMERRGGGVRAQGRLGKNALLDGCWAPWQGAKLWRAWSLRLENGRGGREEMLAARGGNGNFPIASEGESVFIEKP
jgi:hypothetical protein|uniref:Uncharacterized protein n=1 Tax=Zea mays TaxID=4577 RepID=A0A804PEM9_MAIZE